MSADIVSRRKCWLLLRVDNYLWLQTSRTRKVAVYRVEMWQGKPHYTPLIAGRIPGYAKHMTEVYCELHKEIL